MAEIVVVFDFDKTIIDCDSDNWVIDNMGATQLFEELLPTMPWNSLMDRMMRELHSQGKTIEEIADCLKRVPLYPEIITAIKSAHALGCDLRIVSDANLFFIETILKHHGLIHYFSEINTNPSFVDEDGKLRIFPYHDFTSSPHGCTCNHCPPNMCKGLIMERIRASVLKDGKKRFIYLGDGKGDFCPSLKLGERDHVMPRRNYPVWDLICDNPLLLKAEIHEWGNAEELERVLLHLINEISSVEDINSSQLLSIDCKFHAGLAFLLAAAAVGSHATSSSESYWQKVLPNTHMPASIREFFNLDLIDEKTGTNVDVGKGGVHVDTGKTKGGTTVDVGKGGVDVNTGKGQPKGGTTVGVGKGGVNVNTGKGKPKGGTTVGVGKGGVNVNTGHKGKPVVVTVGPKSPFLYKYAASTEQLHDPKLTLFFLEKDLHTGAKMNLIFSKAISASKLPRGSVSGPSLDGKKLPEILNQFSIEPKSSEAEAIKETLQTCNEPANEGEDRYCATSVESMIDFTVSKIGANVQALSTTVDKESSNQLYTIAPGVQKMSGPKSVACHAQTYVYPVYYCHETVATSAYVVPLVGMDGSKVKAVAVCHKDTSSWNPKHLSFQVLKVKPGSVPICHFLPQDHIVWVQN